MIIFDKELAPLITSLLFAPVCILKSTLLDPSILTTSSASIVPTTFKALPVKVKFASPFKLTPLPPVIILLSALFDNVYCDGNVVKFAPLP